MSQRIEEAREVLQGLIVLMTLETDMKRFRNMAAVYIVWQHELHAMQLYLLTL